MASSVCAHVCESRSSLRHRLRRSLVLRWRCNRRPWIPEWARLTDAVLAPQVSFACVKITAICPVSLLERVSDLLRWEQKDPAAGAPWRRHRFPVLCDASPLYHTAAAPPPLTPEEEQGLEQAHRRLTELCGRCAEVGLPLLVDAEYTSVQPAIDYLAYAAAARFNRGPTPIVYTTVQAYLKDSKERLVMATAAAEKEGISMGFKLVRGAYMTREVKLATSLGVPPPIHRTIQETHRCYNTCALFMLEKAARGGAAVVLATHNLESGKSSSSSSSSSSSAGGGALAECLTGGSGGCGGRREGRGGEGGRAGDGEG